MRKGIDLVQFFSTQEAGMFNRFIEDVGLIEIQLGEKKFTWMNKMATKMSNFD